LKQTKKLQNQTTGVIKHHLYGKNIETVVVVTTTELMNVKCSNGGGGNPSKVHKKASIRRMLVFLFF
jgi:hypothetical protein